MLFPCLLLLFSISGSHAQFAEIASLATSLLGGGLGGLGAAGTAAAGAGQAAGALGQIGQLYQLAQGALQLTSTGVGVLNQATEGNWFPAALETAAKNGEALRNHGGGGLGGHGLGGMLPGLGAGGGGGGGLPGLGGLMGLGPLGPKPAGGSGSSGVGSEFGTSFPAPDVDDYNEDLDVLVPSTTPKPKDPFEEVEDRDLQRPTLPTTRAATTTTEDVTLFPDEEEFGTLAPTAPPKKQIRIELPKEEEDYIDQVTKEDGAEVEVTNREKKDGDEVLLSHKIHKAVPTNFQVDQKVEEVKKDRKVPNLEKLLDTLRQKSGLSEEEIMELIGQVEGNGNIEKPPKIDFNSGVQNIAEKKVDNRKRIIDASRRIDANWRGSTAHGHRLSTVTIPVTPPSTPAPFVHTTVSPEIANNRLQREITAGGHDKDLALGKVDAKQVVNKISPPRQGPAQPVPAPPRPAPTQPPATAAPYTYPQNYGQARPAAVGQQYGVQQPQSHQVPVAQQHAPVQGSPSVQQTVQQPAQQVQQPYQTYQNQYYYQNQLQQVPQSYPIQQQQYYPQYQYPQQYPWTQQQYQYYYQQHYPQQVQQQQATVQQGAQQHAPVQQQYHTQQVQVPQQAQPQQTAPQGGQQQGVQSQLRAQANQVTTQQYQQPSQSQAQQQVAPQGQRQVEAARPPATNKAVQSINGQSNTVFTNKPGQEKFFFTPSKEAVIRGRRNQAQGTRISRQSTRPPHKRFYPRTAQTQPLTTPSPVGRGHAANPSLTKN